MRKTVLFTETELKNKVGEIAHYVNKKQHEQSPVFICVLNGAFMFFTDLVKHINKCEIDFIQAKSYTGTTQGEIKLLKDILVDIQGKDVYLVDDIFDSGNTIRFLTKHLAFKEPKSITPITLFKHWHSNHPDLIYGFELQDEAWLVGYGLDDEKGLNRNLKHIVGIPRED
jgi:hypoxanthine phosphoribosyltransferase